MLKPKLKLFGASLLVFLAMAVSSMGGLAAHALAVNAPAPAGSVPVCDPSSDWWCKGTCDNSVKIDKGKDAGKTKYPLTYTQYRSCKCDGSPNLTGDALTSCEHCKDSSNQSDCLANNPITKRINTIIYVLSGLVAVIITINVIVAGIQYGISGESANQIQAAKKRMYNSAIAFLLFILIFTFLQWLIPGGL